MNTSRILSPRLTFFVYLLPVLLFLPSMSQAATRKVPSQYPTIQAGIDAAQSGETVLVADGTYTGTGNRDLDFGGKILTVKSEHGPTKTILDCQATQAAPHRGFYIRRSEPVVAIDGFTVTHGYDSNSGGGAYIDAGTGSVTLTNCAFHDNQAGGNGGGSGIYINSNGGSVTLSVCTFTDNSTSNSSTNSNNYGGGAMIVGTNATVIVDKCAFSHNIARGGTANGGGAYLRSFGGTVTVTNSNFTDENTAFASSNSAGGGLYVDADSFTLSHCFFENNVSTGASSGGGAYLHSRGGTVLMTDCDFEDNTVNSGAGGGAYVAGTGKGGGAYIAGTALTTTVERCAFQDSTVYSSNYYAYGGGAYIAEDCVSTKITNCAFRGNHLVGYYGNYGGGVFIDGNTGTGAGSITLTNGSFHGNTNGGGTMNYGGAVAAFNHTGLVRVTNCIAWDDVNFASELYLVANSPSTVGVTYSDIKGGYAGTGNRNVDPKFVNAAAGDLHLQASSPCRSAGTTLNAPTTDLDGNPRPNPPSMGAYDIFTPLLVTLAPAAVYGGESSTGTVTLGLAAPSGGALVTLVSNTGYAVVPASFLVPAGATSTTFRVITAPVTATKAATFTVHANGARFVVSLLIYPPALKYLTLSPTTVRGGHQNSVATVTLTSPAPSGGSLISLSSNTGYAVVPSSILVPAGGRTAAFTVNTKAVSADKGATVTAVHGSIRKSAGLLLTP